MSYDVYDAYLYIYDFFVYMYRRGFEPHRRESVDHDGHRLEPGH